MDSADARIGGDVDHRAAAVVAHLPEAAAGDAKERRQVDLEQLAEDVLRRSLDRALEQNARVGDERVEPPVREVEGPLHGAIRRLAVSVVAFDEVGSGLCGYGLPALTASARERDAHPSRRRRSTAARPMPDVPPVTSATRPSSPYALVMVSG